VLCLWAVGSFEPSEKEVAEVAGYAKVLLAVLATLQQRKIAVAMLCLRLQLAASTKVEHTVALAVVADQEEAAARPVVAVATMADMLKHGTAIHSTTMPQAAEVMLPLAQHKQTY
jgi:hypothetical protein